VTAAAVALWPQTAGAGVSGPPDQSASNTFYVEVTTFITCQVDVKVERFDANASVTTQVVTQEPECLDNAMSVYGEFTGTDGGTITASSGGSGAVESLAVGGVARADRSIHSITFAACSCGNTVELHPK
jgi:hypothetical protein